MADRKTEGGAQAPSNVLAFPQTAKALHLYRAGMSAAGICALRFFQMEPPANVEFFDNWRPDPGMDRSPELALFLALYATLDNGQRNDIQNKLRRLCRDGDGPSARTALDFLTWAERPKVGRP